MILEAYSIFDKKAKTYEPPRFALNENTAKRMFIIMFSTESMYSKFPDDYEVYFLGRYDDETAEFTTMTKPTHKFHASDLVQKNDGT